MASVTTTVDPGRDIGKYARLSVWIGLAATFAGGMVVYAQKAAEDRSAILRWLFQVREFRDGVNIFDKYAFPNPPIFPITFLMPLTYLPPMGAALLWYTLKGVLGLATILMCFRMVRQPGERAPMPGWMILLILTLSFRPILSDLHHANNNLIILFLIVASLMAWRNRYDTLAGLSLALAIASKVTPGLFLVYYLWKRSWKTAAATMGGLVLFLFVVPSAVLGPRFNAECLYSWWHRMLRPFVVNHEIGDLGINQSMPGVLMRYLTVQQGHGRYVPPADLNLASLDPVQVAWIVKWLSIGFVLMLAFLCRTKTEKRDDPRLLGEFALVVLTMLIVSERSWKHHFVTLLLPYTYLCYRLWRFQIGARPWLTLAGGLALSALLILTTSTEVGGLYSGGDDPRLAGHKLAQFYGMFLWAGLVLYGLTAWRVWVERDKPPVESTQMGPMPHVLRGRSRRRAPHI